MCYKIAEWNQRYEVSIKGREPKDGEELRAGPLSYVRLKVYGHRQGAGYRRLQQAAGDRFMEVFGIFCKLLEISGNQTREHRGKLLNERDGAASIEDIAFLLGIPVEQVDFATVKLCDVGWLISNNNTQLNPIKPNSTQHKGTENSGKFRNVPSKAKKTAFDYTDEFLAFWEVYPKKTGKGGAYKSWKKIRPDATLQTKMITAVNEQVKSEQWQKENGQYIPNPATWLNQGRWEDEIRSLKDERGSKIGSSSGQDEPFIR